MQGWRKGRSVTRDSAVLAGDGKCVICDSYVRPCTLVRICDECNYGSYQGRCVICGGPGVSDAYYCKECTIQEKDVRCHPVSCWMGYVFIQQPCLPLRSLELLKLVLGHGTLGFHYQCLALLFITSYLSSPVGSSPCLQSVLGYPSILITLDILNIVDILTLHCEGSLSTLHCTLTVHFLHMLQVTALSCDLTGSLSLGFIKVRDTPDAAKAMAGAAPRQKSVISH